MRSTLRVCLSAFLCIFSCALIPAGRLLAQQPTAQEIDQLTGPIALYPDALVFQILAASTNVGTVRSFAGWMEKNVALKGSELQSAAEKAGFSEPLVALAMEQSWRWVPHGAAGQELIIGDEQWPFPVPLVKTRSEWQFDSDAGKAEVLARRIHSGHPFDGVQP